MRIVVLSLLTFYLVLGLPANFNLIGKPRKPVRVDDVLINILFLCIVIPLIWLTLF